MQYTLLSHQSLFKKKSNQLQLHQKQSRLIFLLPLTQMEIVLFYDDFTLFHIEIATLKVLHHMQLPGRVYDAVCLNNNVLILIMIERKNIIQVNLKEKTIEQLFKVTFDSLYTSKKQASQFFLSTLKVFNDSQSFFLQQNLSDDRKVKIIYFPKIKDKDTQKRIHSVIEIESRNHLTLKLDQKSRIVKFHQNPQNNGRFSFHEIDLQTNQKIDIQFQNPSFVLYSTVIDIKKINEDKYIICLNSKNRQHQLVLFSRTQKSRTLLITQNIIKECIGINSQLNIGIFSFFYGSTIYSEHVRLIDLQNFTIIDQIEIEAKRISFSKDQNYFIQYDPQSRPTSQTKFNTYYFCHKKVKYIKILQNLKVQSLFGHQFCSSITSMLQ